jgi:hypothetical protein
MVTDYTGVKVAWVKNTDNDPKYFIRISGRELEELQDCTGDMAEAFGLDRRIENYRGKRPIGFYLWDLECLLCAIEFGLKNTKKYPDTTDPGYLALRKLYGRIQRLFDEADS